MIFKPLRTAFAPIILRTIPSETFRWRGRTLNYFLSRYNMTWVGERCIEIPIAMDYFNSEPDPAEILEVGNVMSHYMKSSHLIVDKYEVSPGVVNEDILNYKPGRKFKLILSISTFEHIGFDEESEVPSGEKILAAIRCCRGLLSRGGKFVVTLPLGYNPELDRLIVERKLPVSAACYYFRTGRTRWEECDLETAVRHPYRFRFPYANSLLIAEFGEMG